VFIVVEVGTEYLMAFALHTGVVPVHTIDQILLVFALYDVLDVLIHDVEILLFY
jgi:hypothetical protein